MNTAVLPLLARIKIRLRQDKGLAVNTQRFFAEPTYAKQVLDVAEESEDIEVVTAALEIRSLLGWINTGATLASATKPPSGAQRAPQAGAPDETPQGRYVFGARS